ncbi:membrane-bound lytic murein transglycosylase B [Halospina denitrificans]|uniref:Membrane-bound lytic murein transglycosylase B n=1 Tax=Halospina denitrificans TaxID=332522 RepID=A0A4R7JIW3_9GAMM|nr:lytic murein transglycosylase B [Halospina denitrificans]TDT37842.1 membrane-bound lytic murein transglycosylase B [Halospina denitrificans]
MKRYLVLLLLVAWITTGYGAENEHFEDSAEVAAFIDQMAEKEGVERETLRSWLGAARHQQFVIDRISAPAEKVLEWGEYRQIFLTDARVEQGRAFMERHADVLRRAEADFGVPPEIVTAIIGIETFYGRHKGNDRVLDALATLAFDYPPRGDFFRDELRHYLLLAREQGFDPAKPEGSYAGAMGYGQFIASSYRHYAVDFDDDGTVDLFDNPTDAIGSVANYFHEHNWQRAQPVARRLQGREGATLVLPARLLVLKDGNERRHWLAYHNFDVITRYNHSDLYAMAAWQLARSLGLDE